MSRSPFRLLAALVCLSISSFTDAARAQCRRWDPGFGLPGTDGFVTCFAVHDDGSGPALFAGGSFAIAGNTRATCVAKWNGSAWSALGPGFNDAVEALAVFDDGSGPALYAGGQFTHSGDVACSGIAKWDGKSWTPLGPGVLGGVPWLDAEVSALAVVDDGAGPALVVGGRFLVAGTERANSIAKWDGSAWSRLGPGLTTRDPFDPSRVTSLAAFDDGSGFALYAGGYFERAGDVPVMSIARWDGASWSPVEGGADVIDVLCLTVFDDGAGPSLVAGGWFHASGGPIVGVCRWDGTSWSPVGVETELAAQSLAIGDLGFGPEIFAAGSFSTSGSKPEHTLARWNGTNWRPIHTGADVFGPLACFDDGRGTALYVGSVAGEIGGVRAVGLARWDASGWSPVAAPSPNDGLATPAAALAVLDTGSARELYAGCRPFWDAQTESLAQVARWDGSTWHPLSDLGAGTSGVTSLCVFDDGSGSHLYAGGDIHGTSGPSLNHVAKWDGSEWRPLDSGLSGGTPWIGAMGRFDDGSGDALFVAGRFTSAGGGQAKSIAKWDGTSWSALGAGVSDLVLALASYDDGVGSAVYAAGHFDMAGGSAANNIARWNGSSWAPLAEGLHTTSPIQAARALAVFDDGTGPALYVGGGFDVAGIVPVRGVARWNGSWSSPGTGIHGDSVQALAAFDGGAGPALYAACTSPLGSWIERWDGSVWSIVGPRIDAPIAALAAHDDGRSNGPDLFAVGWFTSVGSNASAHVAALRACAPASSFCLGDGSARRCPCDNDGLPDHGCENESASGGARLRASGEVDPDSIVLSSEGEPAGAPSMFLQSSRALTSIPFGNGLVCIGGPWKRLFVSHASGGVASAPDRSGPSITRRSADLGDPITPGSTRYYQVAYRDHRPSTCLGSAGGTFNLSSGVAITW